MYQHSCTKKHEANKQSNWASDSDTCTQSLWRKVLLILPMTNNRTTDTAVNINLKFIMFCFCSECNSCWLNCDHFRQFGVLWSKYQVMRLSVIVGEDLCVFLSCTSKSSFHSDTLTFRHMKSTDVINKVCAWCDVYSKKKKLISWRGIVFEQLWALSDLTL